MQMSSAFGFRYAHENPFSYEFSCGVCSRVVSDEDLDAMIVCEGGCKRIFHMDCIGLSALPDGAASKWACSRCIQRLRSCHICDGMETVKSSASMVKCSVAHCGKLFHPGCIEAKYGGMRAGGVCSLHHCGVESCTAAITDECYFCIHCLKAYHLRCLPEEVEVICENTCVCLDHQFACPSGGSLITDRLSNVVLGRQPTKKRAKTIIDPIESVPSTVPSTTTSPTATCCPDSLMPVDASSPSLDEESVHRFIANSFSCPFKVSTAVSDANIVLSDDDELVATTKPKEGPVDTSGLSFVRLRANEWICTRPKQVVDEESFFGHLCGCVGTCGTDCANAICMQQCDATNCTPTTVVKRAEGGWKGFQCGNKPFLKGSGTKADGKYKVVSAGSKGMGLVAKGVDGISAGDFIVEYIGEVLTVDGWAERQKAEPAGSSRHFYVMDLDGDHVVDASRKGNDSRLINHSCDPNLETQKWTVNGESRIGLFAIANIPKDTELTFNYQFETFASKPFKCLCATAKCTGWIGGRQKSAKQTAYESKQKKDNAPLALLQQLSSVDIRISAVRTDGTRKKDDEMALEEISACKEKIDYFLQYVWAGPLSGEQWLDADKECATLYPERLGLQFNPAAVLALSVTKIESQFVKERNLLVLRQLHKARRDLARRFYVWADTAPAVERILESNWISDDVCVRCRRTGNLVWCKSCVRSFHQCCVGYGDLLKTDPSGDHVFTCRRCRRIAGREQPPIRLDAAARAEHWKQRRQSHWLGWVLPNLVAKTT